MTPSLQVGFRLDASPSMGSGHLMRCLSLAQTLRNAGARCVFLMRDGVFCATVEPEGHTLLRLPEAALGETEDALACRRLLAAAGLTRLDWLVQDHYGLGQAWQQALRAHRHRLAVIDDLAERAQDADLLINPNQDPAAHTRYPSLVPPPCRLLLGPRYAPLRDEFSRQPVPVRPGTLRRVLVNFGGTDPANATTLCLHALASVPDLDVDVVIGKHHVAADAVRQLCAQHPRFTLHVQSTRMSELMDQADLAVGATGSSTWERCARGLPSVVLSLAPNQRPLAQAVAEAGAALWLGDCAELRSEDLAATLRLLQRQPLLLGAMGRAAAKLCDGRGNARLATALQASALQLRPASLADEALMLDWRNHPAVRQHSGDSGLIDASAHAQWLRDSLANTSRCLLVAELGGQALAILRFDRVESGEPTVSIYLDPARHGQGWGPEILRAGESYLAARHPLRAIHARIHTQNRASQAAFAAAGYQGNFQEWVLWR